MLGSRLDGRGRASSSSSASPAGRWTLTTAGAPRVSVPVLSNARARTRRQALEVRAALDQHAPPGRAARAETMETGVEITSAQGQAMTSSTSAR